MFHWRRSIAVAVLTLGAVTPALATTLVVHDGGNGKISAAVAQARPGDRIKVLPGIYHEGSAADLNALVVTVPGIELVGRPTAGHPVVLENAGSQSFGIWVSPEDSVGAAAQYNKEAPPCATSGERLTGFKLTGFTVRGFAEDGVHLACVDNFELSGNVSDGNQVYGLFPIFSKHGVISFNEVVASATDAGLYIGQSDDVLINDNHVHASLIGIEVQNSTHCKVIANRVHNNTAGIVVDVHEGITLKTQADTIVSGNSVQYNNRPNTAVADIFAVLPSGIGVLVVGGDGATISGNSVKHNDRAGIAVVSLCLALQLAGRSCDGIDVDPFPNDTKVTKNRLAANGTVPTGNAVLDLLLADLAWDGSGTGNCWAANTFATEVPPGGLPAC